MSIVPMPVLPGDMIAAVERAGRRRLLRTALVLALAALAVALVSLSVGAVAIPVERILAVLAGGGEGATSIRDRLILLDIRLPRLILGFLVGAALAVSGALMQGLFRNPLADPGLIGVSAGAGLAAAVLIVLGEAIFGGAVPFAALPVGACLGGLATTAILYAIATRAGQTAIATLLLAGVAMGALAGAATGILTFVSDDRQLRDLTFWSLGSLGGATYAKVWAILPLLLPLALAIPFAARGLNGLALGEADAFHLGLPVQRIKALVIVCVALAVGASVAAAGLIGFVGIVVPHLLRLVIGPDHRALLPLAALGGGTLLVLSDTLARVLVAPAELPIGIVTAALGAPFFLWLLLRRDAGFLT
jgi:iron complex transport system permease protein